MKYTPQKSEKKRLTHIHTVAMVNSYIIGCKIENYNVESKAS